MLVAGSPSGEDYFGGSVALEGDTAIIGSPRDDPGGSAHVFVRNGTTWTEQAKLLASDGAEADLFGGSVAISGDTAVVGAHLDDLPGVSSAAASRST